LSLQIIGLTLVSTGQQLALWISIHRAVKKFVSYSHCSGCWQGRREALRRHSRWRL